MDCGYVLAGMDEYVCISTTFQSNGVGQFFKTNLGCCFFLVVVTHKNLPSMWHYGSKLINHKG